MNKGGPFPRHVSARPSLPQQSVPLCSLRKRLSETIQVSECCRTFALYIEDGQANGHLLSDTAKRRCASKNVSIGQGRAVT